MHVCLKAIRSEILRTLPDGFAKLIITSPPYNIGKEYEKQVQLEKYLEELKPVIAELARVVHPEGSETCESLSASRNGDVWRACYVLGAFAWGGLCSGLYMVRGGNDLWMFVSRGRKRSDLSFADQQLSCADHQRLQFSLRIVVLAAVGGATAVSASAHARGPKIKPRHRLRRWVIASYMSN